MKSLSDYSIEELKKEIKQRENSVVSDKAPSALENPDYSELQDLCSKYMYDIEKAEYVDDDYPHYIYEAAMHALYGKDVFRYINPRI